MLRRIEVWQVMIADSVAGIGAVRSGRVMDSLPRYGAAAGATASHCFMGAAWLLHRDCRVAGRHANSRDAARIFRPADWRHRTVIARMLRSVFRFDQHLSHVNASNQSMKPTPPDRNAFSVFATAPCRRLSLSR